VKSFLKREAGAFYRMLAENRNEAAIITTACLILVLNYYFPVCNEWLSRLVYFALIPLAVILCLRRNPLDFGLRPGSPRVWGFYTFLFCLIVYPVLYFASGSASLREYYRIDDFSFISYFLVTFLSLFATEFLFRGFLLFGLKDRFGEASIFIQTIPFVLVHLGKPGLETISTVITGILFGYICYRGKSFWPAFIVHMFINVFFITAVNPG
jgi:membrane protease YdiL (CAAX protease family)